jgi:hypothetical protein
MRKTEYPVTAYAFVMPDRIGLDATTGSANLEGT